MATAPALSPTLTPALQLDGTHTVLTPEFVEFNFVLAGLMSRFLAWFLDSVIALLIAAIVLFFVSLLDIAAKGLGTALSLVVWFLIDWGYMILLEAIWSGQTVGKRVLGLRVIQETGVRVSVTQSLLRNLARPVDRLPFFYLVGGLFALFSTSQQRLGDLLAGTIVVRERRLKIPSALERPSGDTSLLNDPDFRARVAKLSTDEEAMFFNAALRREELSMEARLTLFAALATRLQDDLGFTKPAHLSDEKLVMLVTAALASRTTKKSRALQK